MVPPPHVDDQVLAPEEWVDAYGDALFAYALTRLRDRLEAEEAVQETFLSGISHWSQVRGESRQIGWLMGILKRKIIDLMRVRYKLSAQFQAEAKGNSDREDWGENFDDADWLANIPDIDSNNPVEMSELWQVLEDCLSRLPQQQADAFTLTVLDQLEAAAAAEILSVSLAALRVRVHRARVGLARCVSKKWELDKR